MEISLDYSSVFKTSIQISEKQTSMQIKLWYFDVGEITFVCGGGGAVCVLAIKCSAYFTVEYIHTHTHIASIDTAAS